MHFALISFLNARPLWWGLVHGDDQTGTGVVDSFELTSPARCADLLADGLSDLGLIPAIELARIPDLLAIPSICIASSAEVRSVVMISKVPFESIRSVALDPGSRTSVALARILLGERNGMAAYRQIRFDAMEPARLSSLEGHDAAVVIGDPALQISRQLSREGLFCYDLVSEWHSRFAEPFVFALWAGPRSSLESSDRERLLERLFASRNHGLRNLDAIAKDASVELNLPYGELIEYFSHALHYDFGEREQKALQHFFQLAARYGLIEEARDIEWACVPHTALTS